MKKLTREEKFMKRAITAAKRGLKQGEVPIGAVVVYEGKVISRQSLEALAYLNQRSTP